MVRQSITDFVDEIFTELERQDRIHPAGYPCTRDGIRLGLAAAEDEIKEALDEWHIEKKRPAAQFIGTRNEALQAAVVLLRVVRSIPA